MNKKMDDMFSRMKQLKKENVAMTNEICDLHNEVETLQTENKNLKVKCNLNFLAADSQNQYGRKESFRAINVPEPSDVKDDKPRKLLAN